MRLPGSGLSEHASRVLREHGDSIVIIGDTQGLDQYVDFLAPC